MKRVISIKFNVFLNFIYSLDAIKFTKISINFQGYETGYCNRTDCHLPLGKCPNNEIHGLGDLSVKDKTNNTVACLSPCTKWTCPAPFGQGKKKENGDGRMFCCPLGVSPEECQNGLIVQTEYVKLLRSACPSAYSHGYVFLGKMQHCPTTTNYTVSFFSQGLK